MGAFSPGQLKKGRSRYNLVPLSDSIKAKRTHRNNNSLIQHALMESDQKTR